MTLFRPPTRGFWASALAIAPLILPMPAIAEPFVFVGARSQGMGGAGVAVVDDSLASYWNPGRLSIKRAAEVAIPIGAQASAEGGVVETLNGIFDRLEDAKGSIATIEAGGALTAGQLRQVLGIMDAIVNRLGLDTAGQGFAVGAHAGVTGRYKGFGFNALGLGSGAFQPNIDLSGLSLSNDPSSASARVTDAVGAGLDRSGMFSFVESQTLADQIAIAHPGVWQQNQAEEYLFQSELSGLDPRDPNVANLLAVVASSTAGGAPRGFLGATGMVSKGIITAEAAFAYGHGFELPVLGKLGVGASFKYMHGTTFTQFTAYDDVDGVGTIIKDLFDGRNTRDSSAFGLDLGGYVQPLDWFSLGLLARNVNSPSFDTAGFGSFVLEPQVRMGVALYPWKSWILALDVDLTKNGSESIVGLESRQISFGTEIVLPVWKVDLALRTGLWTNLAAAFSEDLAWKAGLGLKVWQLSFDLTAGAALKGSSVEFDGGSTDVPNRLNLAATLKWEMLF